MRGVSIIAALPFVLAAGGCRPRPVDSGWTDGCDPRLLASGEARARRMPCDEEGLEGGEGRRGDYVLENACARFVLHHPASALTLLEVGGGTVIDAAPPGGVDTLAEAVPLVQGGWLRDVALEILDEPAAVRVTGTPYPIRFLGGKAGKDAEPASVIYRLEADDCALQVEGNDGFWVLPGSGAVRAGATLRLDGALLAVDGTPEDLGGGVLYEGGARIAAGAPSDVLAALWSGGPEVSGTTAGEGVELLAGGDPVGWLPVDDEGAFSGFAPLGTDAVRALAEGAHPGPDVEPGPDLWLPSGAVGWLGVRAVGRDGAHLAALVSATDAHGRRAQHPVEPEGSWLPLGAGSWDIAIRAGPLRERIERHVGLENGGVERIEVRFDAAGPPPGWVLADLDLAAWPSRDDRRPPSTALADAGARGVGFAVLTAPDEVATVEWLQPWDRLVLARPGSRAATDLLGGIVSWSWKANERKPGHGAVPWAGLSAEDVLRVAAGTSDPDRLLVVEADWVRAAGPAFGWEPRPDLLRLRTLGDLDLVLGLAHDWVDVPVAGPLTWVDVGHGAPVGEVDVERALVEGRTVASTGPLLRLEVDGAGPGSRATGRGAHEVVLDVRASPDQPLDGAGLVADGALVRTWDLTSARGESRLEAALFVVAVRYLFAFAWGPPDGTDPVPGDAWAVTSPVWAGDP